MYMCVCVRIDRETNERRCVRVDYVHAWCYLPLRRMESCARARTTQRCCSIGSGRAVVYCAPSSSACVSYSLSLSPLHALYSVPCLLGCAVDMPEFAY